MAIRDGRLWTRSTLNGEIDLETGQADRLRQKGVYLVTGASGAIGARMAQWLRDTADARLVLLSRGGQAPDSVLRCSRLAPFLDDPHALIRAVDVADARALAALRAEIPSGWGPVRGIVHAAGIVGQRLIVNGGARGELAAVCRAKVHGTLALAEVFAQDQLDFVLLCSSLAASTGPVGQAAYAAANAWLDGTAL